MKFFTYNDYRDCIDNKKLIQALRGEEKIKNQSLKKGNAISTSNRKETLLASLLQDKKEVSIFLQELLSIQINKKYPQGLIKIPEKNTRKIKYQFQGKEIYCIIRWETKPNPHMAYILLKDSIEEIRRWEKRNQTNQTTFPIIIPIVLHTGKEKWDAKRNFRELRARYTTFSQNRINLSYNIIDSNEYTKEELKNKKSLISNALLLFRCKTEKEEKYWLKNIQKKRKQRNTKKKKKEKQ